MTRKPWKLLRKRKSVLKMKLWIKTFSKTAARLLSTGVFIGCISGNGIAASKNKRQKHQLSRRSTYQALLDSVTTGKDSTKFHIINETTKVDIY